MANNKDINAVVAEHESKFRKSSLRKQADDKRRQNALDAANETSKSGYRLMQRTKPKDMNEGSPDLIGGGESMAELNTMNQAEAIEKLNLKMGSSNSAAFLTKYLELHNLYPSDTPKVQEEFLNKRKPSALINQNSYVTVSMAAETEKSKKPRTKKKKKEMA